MEDLERKREIEVLLARYEDLIAEMAKAMKHKVQVYIDDARINPQKKDNATIMSAEFRFNLLKATKNLGYIKSALNIHE